MARPFHRPPPEPHMADRPPDRGGARWAYAAGAIGATSNALLVGFFALIPTFGEENALGPANDLVGSLGSACMIPAAWAVGRCLPAAGPIRVLMHVTVAGQVASAAAGPLLVAGVLPFAVATCVSLTAYGALVGWIGLGSRWLARTRRLPPGTARLGQAIAGSALVGAAAAGCALALPGHWDLRGPMLGVAGLSAATSIAMVPLWWLLVGRWLGAGRSAESSAWQGPAAPGSQLEEPRVKEVK